MDIDSSSKSKDLHVLIVGAGITGLAIAQGLQKAGIRFSIYEAEVSQAARTREWTIAIHWSKPALEKLLPATLYARLNEAYCDPFYEYTAENSNVPMYNGKNGELMNQIVAPGMVRVSRRRLRALCSDGITIQYGKQLTDVTYSNINGDVTAHFADGSSVKGDILIGTDGPQSMVRRHLFGIEKAAPTPTKIVANATLVRYDNAEVAKNIRSSCPIIGLSFSPEGVFSNISVQDVIDPSDPTSWSFQLFMSWLGDADASLTGTDRLKVLKTVAEGLAEPFRTANLSIPSGTQVFNDKMSYWIPVAWDDRGGKITLAGDAAHPMPPFRGQGLNHSITDAINLVEAIQKIQADRTEMPELIASYNSEMIKRCGDEVKSSVKNAYLVHDWEKLMESPLMKVGIKKTS